MHAAKTDSEATSSAPSSPARSPRRPAYYYVQSPSQDDKTTYSAHHFSTPVALSPAASPPRSVQYSSAGRHSRGSSSSSTRFFSGSLKPGAGGGPRKVSPRVDAGGEGIPLRGRRAWAEECAVIEEEGLSLEEEEEEEEERERGLRRRCYLIAFVLAFAFLFSLFSLVLLGVSRSQKPQITMKSIVFESFNVQAGSDATGVPTDMISLNATVRLTFRNTAAFFGLHVSSTPVDLSYTELTLASGSIDDFYQPRKSQRAITVVVLRDRVPAYGGSSSFRSSSDGKKAAVPVGLSFRVRSRAYVLGKLVKPKFYIAVRCSTAMDQNKLGNPVSLANSCRYD